MCGRFAQFLFESLLRDHSVVCPPDTDLSPNYNVAPTQQIFAIVRHEDVKYLEKLSWGLVPFWTAQEQQYLPATNCSHPIHVCAIQRHSNRVGMNTPQRA